MKPLAPEPELLRAAERCVWYEPPEVAIRDAARLVAHILTFGSVDDVRALRVQYSDNDLRAALNAAPPGIFDARSWAYWNLMLCQYNTPPLPTRHFA